MSTEGSVQTDGKLGQIGRQTNRQICSVLYLQPSYFDSMVQDRKLKMLIVLGLTVQIQRMLTERHTDNEKGKLGNPRVGQIQTN